MHFKSLSYSSQMERASSCKGSLQRITQDRRWIWKVYTYLKVKEEKNYLRRSALKKSKDTSCIHTGNCKRRRAVPKANGCPFLPIFRWHQTRVWFDSSPWLTGHTWLSSLFATPSAPTSIALLCRSRQTTSRGPRGSQDLQILAFKIHYQSIFT